MCRKIRFFSRFVCFLLSSFIIFSYVLVPKSPLQASNRVWYKIHTKTTPYYSFTDPIVYQTISSNGEKLLLCVQGRYSKKTIVYVAQSNGTKLEKVFAAGYYPVGSEEIYFTPLNAQPSVSGNGEIVAIAVRAMLDINRRNDFIMIHNIRTRRNIFFQLRQLIPGTNYVRLPELGYQQAIFSMDFQGKKLVTQIEVGVESPACNSFDTAILISNVDGSNQQILVGPEDFVRTNCSFRWKDYPRSPHLPQITRDGDRVAFYGQVFGSKGPYDKNSELFVINSNKSNLRQLTFMRRDEVKLDTLGSFCLNYYGSRIFFKRFHLESYYISSISIDGGNIQDHVMVQQSTEFMISGEGRKIYYLDTENDHSLVYYDISKDITVLMVDKSWSGKPYRYGLLESIGKDALIPSSMTTFLGEQLIVRVSSGQNHWIFKLEIMPSLLVPQSVNMSFKINEPIYTINDRRISLPVPAYLKNNRTMVPLVTVTQHFGFKVDIFSNNRMVYIHANGNLLHLYLHQNKGFMNSKPINIEPPMELRGNVLFVPAGIFRDYFGLQLIWNNSAQTLQIQRFPKN